MRKWIPFVALIITACGNDPTYTYHRDVAPILSANCVSCHAEDGIGGHYARLDSYQAAAKVKSTIARVVSSGDMPPWPPSAECNSYIGERRLTDADIEVLTTWADEDAPEGDKSDAKSAPASVDWNLPIVDAELPMPEAYTPTLSPDDYRCFPMPWTESTTRYVTAINVVPGDPEVVHHVILFLAGPDTAQDHFDMDDQEPGSGYTCFGSAGGSAQPMGGWVPGSRPFELPADTGIAIEPGSAIIIQVHYNTHDKHAHDVTDLTTAQFTLADTVAKPGVVLPWANPYWLGGQMPIPANDNDVRHSFSYDPTPLMSQLVDPSVVGNNQPFLIHTANVHMHLRGKRGKIFVQRPDHTDACLLDVPEWDFHWQGDYALKEPVVFNPGDQLVVQCQWDNSADNQPTVGGEKLASTNLNWGEGTTDEMCIAFMYITGL